MSSKQVGPSLIEALVNAKACILQTYDTPATKGAGGHGIVLA
jgi:hypothetical protein